MITRFLQTIPPLVVAVILTGLLMSWFESLLSDSKVADTMRSTPIGAYSDSITIPRGKITPISASNENHPEANDLLGEQSEPCTCLAFTLNGETSLVQNDICCAE